MQASQAPKVHAPYLSASLPPSLEMGPLLTAVRLWFPWLALTPRLVHVHEIKILSHLFIIHLSILSLLSTLLHMGSPGSLNFQKVDLLVLL